MSTICINRKDNVWYPEKNSLFRPHIAYPEYQYKTISVEQNDVYEMVRECFHMLEMDDDNYGTCEWNPLKEIVKEGDTVLLKPNMVLDKNRSNCGEECLYTNPSVVAAIIDYVVIALKNTGRIIIGDAPLQECDFEKLVDDSGYLDLINFYHENGVNIDLVDFRNTKTFEKNGLHYLREDKGHNGIIVKLGEYSTFSGMSDERLKNLRITNYDPRILQKHHNMNCHEYMVANQILEADVIFNLPKPKTHRKAGVTIALKNLVGINANKEFLPHHTLGSKEEGGDAYLFNSNYLKQANMVLDIRNELVNDEDMESARLAEKLYETLLKKGQESVDRHYWEGSWYGNDTIWRTIVDLNRILRYADKKGVIKTTPQRKIFIVGDMIVSGQKEGPLMPVPKDAGIIAMSNNPVQFDRVICSLMGFNYRDIPSLYNEELSNPTFNLLEDNEYRIISNNEEWNNKTCEEIEKYYSLEFEPTMGWIEKLGNKYREKIIKKLKDNRDEVYIFGAGVNGKYALGVLQQEGITVVGFMDNNEDLWGKEIVDGLKCINPNTMNASSKVIIGMRDEYVDSVSNQIELLGGKYIGTINRGD